MGKQCNHNLPRSLSIADFILEDGGHTVEEAAIEFRISRTSVQRDLNYLACVAFYEENRPNTSELKQKYISVKKTLEKLAKQNNSKKATSN